MAYGQADADMAYGQADAHEVGKPRRPNSTNQSAQNAKTDQVAQNVIVVPSRVINIPRGKTVFGRDRPELDPLGVPVGGFILSPSLRVGEQYSDNIFSVDTGEIDDFILKVSPRVRIRSNWNNHALSFFGGGDLGFHRDNSKEDYEDWNVGTTGRLDVRRDTQIRARAEMKHRHVERSDPDDTAATQPTEYDVFIGQLEGFRRFNRVSFLLGGSVERENYEDDIGTNNDDRDRNEFETSLRVGYKVTGNYEGFARAAYIIREYDDGNDDTVILGRPGLDRDSHGIRVEVGTSIDFGGILFGEFFVGYMTQDYDDILLPAVDGPSVGADLTWNVTPLTTIIGTIKREIRESTLGTGVNFASGRLHTEVGVAVQYELLRNLLLGGTIGAANDDYKGINRTDDTFRFGVNARYLMHRNLYLSGGYNYRARESNIAGSDYEENVVSVQVGVQY
jgi:hypothetical protein